MGRPKIKKEIFIERFNNVHNYLYDYSNMDYINSETKIEIICKIHGSFFQRPQDHLIRGCHHCSKIQKVKNQTDTLVEFKEKANKKHNHFYNYDKAIYINNHTDLIITCPIHSDFEQQPNRHTGGQNCPKCSKERAILNSTKTQEQFIKEVEEKHKYFYDYSKTLYTKSRDNIIIGCPIHGDFKQRAANHLKGAGCRVCGNCEKYTTKEFKKIAKIKHDGFYNYDKSEYINNATNVIITCPSHGDFEQIAGNHLQGGGCKKCSQGKNGGYSRSRYIEKAKGILCAFYTLRCFNEDEEFYKIGITMNSIEKRYSGKKSMPYDYEVISEIKGSAGFIWDLEKEEKRKLEEFKYKPKVKFHGSKNECFTDYKIEDEK